MTRRCLLIVGGPPINMHRRRRSFPCRTVSFIIGGADKRSGPEIPPFVISSSAACHTCGARRRASTLSAVHAAAVAGRLGSLSRPRRSYCSLEQGLRRLVVVGRAFHLLQRERTGPRRVKANNERRRATAIDRSHFWLASLETLSRARVQNQMFRRSRCLTHQWPSACIGIIRLI